MPLPVCTEAADVFADTLGRIIKSGAWSHPDVPPCLLVLGSGQLSPGGNSLLFCERKCVGEHSFMCSFKLKLQAMQQRALKDMQQVNKSLGLCGQFIGWLPE